VILLAPVLIGAISISTRFPIVSVTPETLSFSSDSAYPSVFPECPISKRYELLEWSLRDHALAESAPGRFAKTL